MSKRGRRAVIDSDDEDERPSKRALIDSEADADDGVAGSQAAVASDDSSSDSEADAGELLGTQGAAPPSESDDKEEEDEDGFGASEGEAGDDDGFGLLAEDDIKLAPDALAVVRFPANDFSLDGILGNTFRLELDPEVGDDGEVEVSFVQTEHSKMVTFQARVCQGRTATGASVVVSPFVQATNRYLFDKAASGEIVLQIFEDRMSFDISDPSSPEDLTNGTFSLSSDEPSESNLFHLLMARVRDLKDVSIFQPNQRFLQWVGVQDADDSHTTGLEVTEVEYEGSPLHVLTVIIKTDSSVDNAQKSFLTKYSTTTDGLKVYEGVTDLSRSQHLKIVREVKRMRDSDNDDNTTRFMLGPRTLKMVLGTDQTMLYIHPELIPMTTSMRGDTRVVRISAPREEDD